MKTRSSGLIAIALLAGGIGPALAAPPPVGRLLTSQCFQCHGTNGRGPADIDSFTGSSANELFQELHQFKAGGGTSIMGQQPKAYTDAELRAIAAYAATLPVGGN